MTSTTTLARNIRFYRELLGWSQEQLSKYSGVASVAMIESGKRKNPRGVEQIAKALGVPVSVLYEEPPTTMPYPAGWENFLKNPLSERITPTHKEFLLRMGLVLDGHGAKPTDETYYLLWKALLTTSIADN